MATVPRLWPALLRQTRQWFFPVLTWREVPVCTQSTCQSSWQWTASPQHASHLHSNESHSASHTWQKEDRQAQTENTQNNLHTHIGPFSRTTQVSRYQKGKTNLDFTEARDSKWQRHQLGHMQVCISLQTDNHASTLPLSFLQAGCPSWHPPTASKHWRQNNLHMCSNYTTLLYSAEKCQ